MRNPGRFPIAFAMAFIVALIPGLVQNTPSKALAHERKAGRELTSFFIHGNVLRYIRKDPAHPFYGLHEAPLNNPTERKRRFLPLEVPRSGKTPKHKFEGSSFLAIAINDRTHPNSGFALTRIVSGKLQSVEDHNRRTLPSQRNTGFNNFDDVMAGVAPLFLAYMIHPGEEDEQFGEPDQFIHYDFYHGVKDEFFLVLITLGRATVWKFSHPAWEKVSSFPCGLKGDFSVFVKDGKTVLLSENGKLYCLMKDSLIEVATAFSEDTPDRVLVDDQDAGKFYLVGVHGERGALLAKTVLSFANGRLVADQLPSKLSTELDAALGSGQ